MKFKNYIRLDGSVNEFWYKYEGWIFPSENSDIGQIILVHLVCCPDLVDSEEDIYNSFKCFNCNEDAPILAKMYVLSRT